MLNALIAAVSLFVNGFGVYLTIQANIGAGPWDVLNLGIARSLGILYGTASIIVSLSKLSQAVIVYMPVEGSIIDLSEKKILSVLPLLE